MVVEAACGRVPDATDINRKVGRVDNGRVARADDLGARVQNVQDGDRPRIVCVERAAVSHDEHAKSRSIKLQS